jgi:hypothetical protein
MTAAPENPSAPEPIGYRRWSEEWWENRGPGVKERRCTAHRRTGEQCRNPAILGATVCRYHGGAAKQVVRAARIRLQNAAEKMARELLGMATDPSVSDSVKLAAIRDALDRAGLKPITTVDLEVSTKPWEQVFEGISKVVAGPRETSAPALEIGGGVLGEGTDNLASESVDDADVVIGEIDDDPLPEGEDEVIDSGYTDAESVIDVGIVNPDVDVEIMNRSPGTTTPDQDQNDLSVDPGLTPGPLGLSGPAGSGLMRLEDAVEAAAEMQRRANLRDIRRR